jgi:hypothetical protein
MNFWNIHHNEQNTYTNYSTNTYTMSPSWHGPAAVALAAHHPGTAMGVADRARHGVPGRASLGTTKCELARAKKVCFQAGFRARAKWPSIPACSMPDNAMHGQYAVCSFGWWLVLICSERSTAGWFLVAGLFREKKYCWLVADKPNEAIICTTSSKLN